MREDSGIAEAWTGRELPARQSRLVDRVLALLRGESRPQARLLRHVETLSLGQKRSLYLVECDGERFLIAAGTDTLSAPVPLPQKPTTQRAPEAGS